MKHVIVVALVLCMCLLSSCKHNEKDSSLEEQFFVIPIAHNFNKVQTLNLSDLGEQVEYIRLETTPASLIGNIRKLAAGPDGFICHSMSGNNKVPALLRFSSDGKFLNRISVQGQGPTEYQTLIDFTADFEKKLVYVLEYNNIIKIYDFEGHPIPSLKPPKQFSRIEMLCSGAIIGYVPDGSYNYSEEEDRFSLYIIDSSGEILSIASPVAERKQGAISNYYVLFYKTSADELGISPGLNDTIFRFDEEGKSYAYGCFDLGVHSIDDSKTFEDVAAAEHNFRRNNIIDTSRGIFVRFACACIDRQNHWGYYSKESDRFFRLENDVLENDWDHSAPVIPLTQYGGCLIGLMDPLKLYNWIESAGTNPSLTVRQQNLVSFMRGLKEDDNPILVLIK